MAQPFNGFRLLLAYAPRRVHCPRCGVTTEAVPWARHGSRFTRDFEELVAYLAASTDKTTVQRLMGISWRTVGSIVDRVVADHLDPSRFDGLRRIGVDEFSYRKHHRYLTVVVDHDRHAVIWAAKGRGSDTLGVFFNRLGKARSKEIETVTLDMAGGYIKALRERVPQAELVFDRFHVQRLASDALDEVRRAQWREQKDTEEGEAIKGCRYSLLKNPWNLTQTERKKLREVQRTNMPLYRAYLLKETLAKALDYRQPKRARRMLDAWLVWASHCHLPSFVKLAKTIREHKEGILAYIRERMTNGVVEGINTRLRSITRRAFGFHSARPLIAMMYLCCSGIQLSPRLP
jgi:transposase